jgi:hypothetical protein
VRDRDSQRARLTSGAFGTLSLALLALQPLPAAATLGENLASVQADGLRISAIRRASSSGLATQVHTLTLADGGTIRQYADASGRVYAVAWNTRSKPRLDQLLGQHFAAYAEGGRRAMQRRAGVMHSGVVQQGDLVVESSAHLNAHVGRAYLRSLLPAGGAADAIR